MLNITTDQMSGHTDQISKNIRIYLHFMFSNGSICSLSFTGTHSVDHGPTHRLVRLRPTLVTRVGGNRHHRLDLSCPGDNPPHCHQLPNAVCLDLPHRNGSLPWGPEVDLTAR